MNTSNNSALASIIAQINEAKAAIKSGAVTARAAAPKGEKMAHGQHFAAEQSAKVANASLSIITGKGFVPAAIAAKVSKTGRTGFLVTYRETQTLAQRVETVKNAAARRKEKRAEAAKAKAAKVTPMPATNADALAALNAIAKAA